MIAFTRGKPVLCCVGVSADAGLPPSREGRMEMKMTAVRGFPKRIQKRLTPLRESVSQASHMFRPVIRLQDQAEMLNDYVHAGASILDVGCGTGYLSKYLEEMYAVKSTGLDVKDLREQPITFYSFDGTTIPFPTWTFDCVLLSYSLHHAHDPVQLIQECHRVARRTIIVFEDLPRHLFASLMLFIHVWIFAVRYPSGPARSPRYREALKWLGDRAVDVTQTAIPPKWLHTLYPRFLLVYTLSTD